MSLFDQHPMGPIPARRPILIPDDPEVQAAGIDRSLVEVTVMSPAPRELRGYVAPPRRSHRLRIAVCVLLLLPYLPSVYEVLRRFVVSEASDPGMYPATMLAVFLVFGIILCAHLIARSRDRGLR